MWYTRDQNIEEPDIDGRVKFPTAFAAQPEIEKRSLYSSSKKISATHCDSRLFA